MKCLRTMLLVSVVVCGSAFAQNPTVALPPFTYTGRVMNSSYASISELTDRAELRVRTTNGVLLATSTIETHDWTTKNYRLPVPITSVSTPTMLSVNDPVRFELLLDNTLYTAHDMFPTQTPTKPGGIVTCDIIVGTDSNNNGIADEYEKMMNENELPYWSSRGFPNLGTTYDPDADYDGDGADNRHEYLAGTDPFSADDKFRVLSFVQSEDFDGGWELKFFGNRARTYLVKSGNAVTNVPSFKQDVFMEKGDANETVRSLINVENSGAGVRTLILLPGEANQMFYNVEVK